VGLQQYARKFEGVSRVGHWWVEKKSKAPHEEV
jgi:hypothetical protein